MKGYQHFQEFHPFIISFCTVTPPWHLRLTKKKKKKLLMQKSFHYRWCSFKWFLKLMQTITFIKRFIKLFITCRPVTKVMWKICNVCCSLNHSQLISAYSGTRSEIKSMGATVHKKCLFWLFFQWQGCIQTSYDIPLLLFNV